VRDDLPISIRPVAPTDYGYILQTYTKSLHQTHPLNFIPNQIFFPFYTEIINKLLTSSTTLVACIDDDPDQIVGYMIGHHHNTSVVIHWATTKGIFRRLGVMKALLNEMNPTSKNVICSHYFDLFKKIKDKYHLIYDPTVLQGIV